MKPLAPTLRCARGRADRGGIGHHLRHLGAGAVARVHGQERDLRQVGAHRDRRCRRRRRPAPASAAGCVSRSTRCIERAGDVQDRLAGADPVALRVDAARSSNAVAARRRDCLQPVERQPRRRDHRPAHEDRVGDPQSPKRPTIALVRQEIAVGPARAISRRPDGLAWPRPSWRRGAAGYCAAAAPAVARRAARSSFSSSAIRKASSSAWLGVQPRVADACGSGRTAPLGDRLRAADAFGDVLAGHLDMHAAGMGALGVVDGEEAAHLGQDAVERPGLVAGRRLDRVAVHRVARPDHLAALALHRADQRRQLRLDLVGAHAGDQGQAARARSPGSACRSGAAARPAPASARISGRSGSAMPRRNSTCAPSSWRVRSPIHSIWRRAVVPVAGGANRRGSAPARRAAAAPRGWCRTRSRVICGASSVGHAAGAP